ncbi:hypothetical protein ACS0TY_005887 [Phlomoides rotata]
MEQSDFDSITTRVRHLRENITELQKNYDQLTLHVKVSGNVQQADLDIVQTSIHGVGYAQRMLWQALKRPLLMTGSPSVTHKEKVHQVEPRQVPQVIEPGKADSAYTINVSFLLNTMTRNTTRFANDVFEQKRAMIWENKLIGTENTQRKTCNMMHVERWHERICQFCAT